MSESVVRDGFIAGNETAILQGGRRLDSADLSCCTSSEPSGT